MAKKSANPEGANAQPEKDVTETIRRPYVGEMVICHDLQNSTSDRRKTAAAMVTAVHSVNCVNLNVFPDGEKMYHQSSVTNNKDDATYWEFAK